MFYKNISFSTKTFYGVEFKPGDIKEVPGYINDSNMIVTEPIKEPAKQQKPSSDNLQKAKKPEPKHIEQKQEADVQPVANMKDNKEQELNKEELENG